VCHDEPDQRLRERRSIQTLERRIDRAIQAVLAQFLQPASVVGLGRRGQAGQPSGIIVIANESFEQTCRNPLVPDPVTPDQPAIQSPLKGIDGFAEVVQQPSQINQHTDQLAGMPVVLIPAAQDIPLGRVGRSGSLSIRHVLDTSAVDQDAAMLEVVQIGSLGMQDGLEIRGRETVH
jgi:hypothetical protein